MAGNTFGKSFSITTFGESHGKAIGVIIDGCPAGLDIDAAFIQRELDRRRPGQSRITTQRKESDTVQILSGIYEGKSTGTPISLLIPNEDQRSKDYDHIRSAYRPSHADFTYDSKYGIRDHRGGGRSSARETAARVAAGAVAKLLLQQAAGISVQAYVSRVANIKLEKSHKELDLTQTETTMVRCPDEGTAQRMIELIDQVRKDGDTVGGVVTCVADNCPAGLGEPVFDKLHADLAKAMLSINAAHGFEYGSGFDGTYMRGSEHNDLFENEGGRIRTRTNRSGGIQGGISNGETIYFNVGFKPIATIMKPQTSVDRDGGEAEVKGKGRHDPCVLPRAVPIVEAMAALVLADHLLRNRNARMG
ncbi:chorismate synthase [Anseongella ginsenosidimutans]|uniref:Chorismate synthase n=1 Tax=Anseongella ginsenosidimutans TaxID=496056 RepID=A0A4R3KNI4_9SPHI|nr:chorismate synthase [Anseongella ginsenosidimutans]QEC52512.1 chorismate synthase [Anseongella ginsenosidimutans]TCS85306.1 chorismate synthase [Anseongella ginsenosidimutans]